MAVRQTTVQFVYGIGDNLIQLPPQPIVAKRNPSTQDQAQIGTTWINTLTNTVWILTSIASNTAVWTTSPAAGATIVASLQVTGLGGIVVDTGNVDITLGDLSLAAGNATIAGNLTVAGVTTITGDLDLTSAAQIDLTSTLNAADAIVIEATAGGIDILASGAAAGEDIDIIATGSSVNIRSTESAADSIFIQSTVGGIDIFASGAAAGEDIDIVATGSSVNISATENVADSITVTSTAGGIDITAAGAAGEDIDIVCTAGSVNVTSGEVIANSMVLTSAGGLDITVAGTGLLDIDMVNTAGSININSGEAAADAVRIVASNAGGGIDIDAGTAGAALDSTGAISLDAAAASNFSVSGAGVDLSLISAAGRVVVNGEEAAADAVRILSAAGGVDLDAALQVNIASSQNAADAIRIVASAGGIDVDAVGAAGEDIVITNTGGSVSVVATEAAADAIVLNASNAAGGIDLLTGGGEISISSAGNVSMVAATDTQASPSATAVINARVGAATFTGFTTASAAPEVFTITNSVVTATSQIFVSAANEGANDAQMTVTRVLRGAGTFDVTLTNNGAAALNGNVTITFWVLN
jgi:hypothetical protein